MLYVTYFTDHMHRTWADWTKICSNHFTIKDSDIFWCIFDRSLQHMKAIYYNKINVLQCYRYDACSFLFPSIHLMAGDPFWGDTRSPHYAYFGTSWFRMIIYLLSETPKYQFLIGPTISLSIKGWEKYLDITLEISGYQNIASNVQIQLPAY